MVTNRAKSKRKSTGGLDRKTRGMVNLTSNPVWRAFASQPVTQSTQTTIGLAGRKALYALSSGHGRFEDFNELVVTAHSALVLAEAGYGADLMGDFTQALATILMCRLLGPQDEEYALNENESQIVGGLLDLHEQQVQIVGKAQLASAIVEAYKRANVAR